MGNTIPNDLAQQHQRRAESSHALRYAYDDRCLSRARRHVLRSKDRWLVTTRLTFEQSEHLALYTENGVAIKFYSGLVEAVRGETMTVNYPGNDEKIVIVGSKTLRTQVW